MTILLMFTYTYAAIGMEIYSQRLKVVETSIYITQYIDFENMLNAFVAMFHIVNESGWSTFELDFAVRFDNLGKAGAFFNSYHVGANLIIISLLTGLIWEVYAFTNKLLKEEQNCDEILANLKVLEFNYNKIKSSSVTSIFPERITVGKQNRKLIGEPAKRPPS